MLFATFFFCLVARIFRHRSGVKRLLKITWTVHRSRCALRSHHVWQLRRLGLKGESLHVRDACEHCGNVVGGRPLVFVHVFSWSCVHLSRHCVNCVGYGLNAIVIVQQRGLRVVPFVVFSSVLGSFHRKDSWRERRTQHERRRKSIASDAALAGRSQLSVCCHSASFKKCARNCSQCCLYHG